MTDQWIFLTGSSGLVGNRCLLKALQDGFKVIASVRSRSKADAVRKSMKGLARADNLDFVFIEDFGTEGVFDAAVSKVDFVVHAAAPRVTAADPSDLDRTLVRPAHLGILNILKAAEKAPSVKKVVLCSSAAAVVTYEKSYGADVDGVTYNANFRVPDSHYEPIKPSIGEHYFAGKARALNATDEFVKKPLHFDVINIFPTSVTGRWEIATTSEEVLQSSNVRALGIAIGRRLDPTPTSCIAVDDLAKMHIDVLKMDTGKYRTFGAGSLMGWQEQVDVIRECFPEAVEKGIFPMNGEVQDRPFLFDCSATEAFFGWKFKPFKDQVRDVAEQYLELMK